MYVVKYAATAFESDLLPNARVGHPCFAVPFTQTELVSILLIDVAYRTFSQFDTRVCSFYSLKY